MFLANARKLNLENFRDIPLCLCGTSSYLARKSPRLLSQCTYVEAVDLYKVQINKCQFWKFRNYYCKAYIGISNPLSWLLVHKNYKEKPYEVK